MTIKQHGGIFGRNPTLNDVEVSGNFSAENGPVNLGRSSSDTGDIAVLSYNGSTVGSIGVVAGIDSYIATGDTGLRFVDVVDAIAPCSSSGVQTDAQTDLGRSSFRFKDVYLSGNVVVANGKGIDFSATSGTGTSELFDDYEEGTFTPEIADASSGGNTGSATVVEGYYTKVGRLVTIAIALIDIDTTGMTAGNNLYVRGLPFSQGAGVDHGSARVNAVTFSGSLSTYCTGTYALVADSTSAASFGYVSVGDCTSGSADIYMSFTYRV